jgi:UDP-glucose 4-epimerase
VNAAATLHEHDIREPLDGLFAELRPEVVVHLAAQADVGTSVEQPLLDAQVNVLGTINVLEAARAHGAQVILASTGGAIYGECDAPALEDGPRLPLSPYGTSKLAAEEYLATWNRLYGASHVALRLGNVYGPRQNPHGEAGVVAIFTSRLLAGAPAVINGDGLQTRDYVYVDDVADANLRAVEQPHVVGVLNIGTGTETSVVELFERLRRVAKVSGTAEHGPAKLGEQRHSALDAAAARQRLGWTPRTSLDEGLRRTVEEFRRRPG